MGKILRLLSIVLFVLGIGCIGMYFVYGENKNEFTVTFDSDGGTPVASQTIAKNGKVTKPENPTKDNSEFVEWQLDGQTYAFGDTVSKDMTLKAKWNEIVLISYHAMLEEVEYTASIRSGDVLTIDAFGFPSKEGFNIKIFDANNEEVDLNQLSSPDETLNAKYIEIKTYTVKFDSVGGSKVEEVKVEEGMPISEPATAKDGYTFDGWYLGNDKFDFTTPITKNITLKAKWKENGKINVTFTVDDKVYKTVGVKENSAVTEPTPPIKTGYKFVEWQLNGTAYDFNSKVTSEITLTATFEKVKSVTVKFDSNGGSKVADQTVDYGAKAKVPANPTRDGYKFVEWQLNNNKYDFGSAVNSDITLKARWAKLYKVTFDSSGGSTVASQEVAEGEKVTKPDDPIKSGEKFAGWLLNNSMYDFSTPITDDITLTARFETNPTPTNETTASSEN